MTIHLAVLQSLDNKNRLIMYLLSTIKQLTLGQITESYGCPSSGGVVCTRFLPVIEFPWTQTDCNWGLFWFWAMQWGIFYGTYMESGWWKVWRSREVNVDFSWGDAHEGNVDSLARTKCKLEFLILFRNQQMHLWFSNISIHFKVMDSIYVSSCTRNIPEMTFNPLAPFYSSSGSLL